MNVKNILIGIIIGLIVGLVFATLYSSPVEEVVTEESMTLTLPNGFVPIGPCFPGKGVHYMNPEDPHQFDPNTPAEESWIGPTYLVSEITGEVIGLEYHVRHDFPEAQSALLELTPEIIEQSYETGIVETDWLVLHGFDLFGAGFNFFDITFNPSHEGYAIPHYDIHLFTKSQQELREKGTCL